MYAHEKAKSRKIGKYSSGYKTEQATMKKQSTSHQTARKEERSEEAGRVSIDKSDDATILERK